MGKFGLSGNSGFLENGGHVAAPYDSNGMVFVESGDWWERVKESEADESKIIRCCVCDKPAVSLDHYWPYFQDKCLCEEHYNERQNKQ